MTLKIKIDTKTNKTKWNHFVHKLTKWRQHVPLYYYYVISHYSGVSFIIELVNKCNFKGTAVIIFRLINSYV